MHDPVDSGQACRHVVDLVASTGASLAGISRAAGISRKTVERIHEPGRKIEAKTQARILAVTAEDLLHIDDPADPSVVARLIDGEDIRLPTGRKAAYFKALRDRGVALHVISAITHSSYEFVKMHLLRMEVDELRLEVLQWRDAYACALKREAGWEQYAKQMEVTLKRISQISDRHAPSVFSQAVRSLVFGEMRKPHES